MIKRLFIVHLILFLTFLIFSQDIASEKEVELNSFLEKNENDLLNELFTVNVGIMDLKQVGNLTNINPIDAQNIVNSIKNVVEKVPAAQLSKKEAIIKAVHIYSSKIDSKDTETIDESNFLKRKYFFAKDDIDHSDIYELFLKFRKNETFYPIAKLWFENIENPFYILNIGNPFERKVISEDKICEIVEINGKKPIDVLIHGEVEKIDKLYFVTIIVYSGLLKKRIAEFSYVAESENLSAKTMEKMNIYISRIFSINFASLEIDTEDENARVYLDGKYIGKNKILIDYLVPGSYIAVIKKENYEDKIENIKVDDYEKKKIVIKPDKEEELQIVNFFIEPYGTKIFINSVFQGRTPFKKAIPKGNYVISAKNDMYESFRYILQIKNVIPGEKNIVFHLKSKDMKNVFKTRKVLYYVSFWNFTFSLATAVPLIVFAYQQWERGGGYYDFYYNQNTDPEESEYLQQNITATYVLYGFAAFFVSYTVLSLGWLFFSLAQYLIVLEKKDFIPILEYYENEEGEEELKIGMTIKL